MQLCRRRPETRCFPSSSSPDHFLGGGDDGLNALAVGVFAQRCAGGHVHGNTVEPGGHCRLHIVHVAADVRHDLGAQTQRRNHPAVLGGLIIVGEINGQFTLGVSEGMEDLI